MRMQQWLLNRKDSQGGSRARTARPGAVPGSLSSPVTVPKPILHPRTLRLSEVKRLAQSPTMALTRQSLYHVINPRLPSGPAVALTFQGVPYTEVPHAGLRGCGAGRVQGRSRSQRRPLAPPPCGGAGLAWRPRPRPRPAPPGPRLPQPRAPRPRLSSASAAPGSAPRRAAQHTQP